MNNCIYIVTEVTKENNLAIDNNILITSYDLEKAKKSFNDALECFKVYTKVKNREVDIDTFKESVDETICNDYCYYHYTNNNGIEYAIQLQKENIK